MRVFIAIEFEEKIKNYLSNQQQIIKENSIKGNFTRKENFHLTLQFIGEVKREEIHILKEVIDKARSNTNGFQLFLKNIGRFERGKKSIVWVGITKNDELEELYYDLENLLEAQGYPKEDRPFKPHITLGRQVIFKEGFEEIQKKSSIEPERIIVNKISLMESTRIDGKLKYIPL
ncbi:RNA 2',3'-cyclic phosphodiesterase [Lutibacter sp. B2]|nr:RNA 2',3'-cyclic phosphodiesterase [Lutibacter sp. B2]